MSSAAVRDGVLKVGEPGIVKVTILPTPSAFKGAGRNGVSSSGWNGSYDCYKVEPRHAKPVAGAPTSIGIVKKAIGTEKSNIAEEVEAVKGAL